MQDRVLWRLVVAGGGDPGVRGFGIGKDPGVGDPSYKLDPQPGSVVYLRYTNGE